jgi:hypothetical protein
MGILRYTLGFIIGALVVFYIMAQLYITTVDLMTKTIEAVGQVRIEYKGGL